MVYHYCEISQQDLLPWASPATIDHYSKSFLKELLLAWLPLKCSVESSYCHCSLLYGVFFMSSLLYVPYFFRCILPLVLLVYIFEIMFSTQISKSLIYSLKTKVINELYQFMSNANDVSRLMWPFHRARNIKIRELLHALYHLVSNVVYCVIWTRLTSNIDLLIFRF